jgi:competence protein ComEA
MGAALSHRAPKRSDPGAAHDSTLWEASMKRLLVLLVGLMFSALALAAINVNTATLQELEALNGIGPVKAQAIIDHRKANGPFKSIEQLKDVKGIGDATFDKIKGDVSVTGATTPVAKTAAPPAASAPAPMKADTAKTTAAAPPAPAAPTKAEAAKTTAAAPAAAPTKAEPAKAAPATAAPAMSEKEKAAADAKAAKEEKAAKAKAAKEEKAAKEKAAKEEKVAKAKAAKEDKAAKDKAAKEDKAAKDKAAPDAKSTEAPKK